MFAKGLTRYESSSSETRRSCLQSSSSNLASIAEVREKLAIQRQLDAQEDATLDAGDVEGFSKEGKCVFELNRFLHELCLRLLLRVAYGPQSASRVVVAGKPQRVP